MQEMTDVIVEKGIVDDRKVKIECVSYFFTIEIETHFFSPKLNYLRRWGKILQ